MPPFLVCLHDATPAFERETRTMLRDLAPLVGRRLTLGVVPDWHGRWPLGAHRGYCRMVHEAAESLLLHGYAHQRRRGSGPVTLLTGGCDEMNGLDRTETRQVLERGQRVFADAFGERARGFLAPGWQRGHVRGDAALLGLEHVLGFFSLDAVAGQPVLLATFTWDCGRWSWLGHVGEGIGHVLHAMGDRVPVLALHPADLTRGFWPRILRLTAELRERGYVAAMVTDLLAARC
jgi:peptidoglycan/xylan/chitin deacetylase (PgdA/CDA1 family)